MNPLLFFISQHFATCTVCDPKYKTTIKDQVCSDCTLDKLAALEKLAEDVRLMESHMKNDYENVMALFSDHIDHYDSLISANKIFKVMQLKKKTFMRFMTSTRFVVVLACTQQFSISALVAKCLPMAIIMTSDL